MNKVIAIVAAIAMAALSFSAKTNNNGTIADYSSASESNNDWCIANIYDIQIINGMYTINGEECLVSNPLDYAIKRIISDDKTAYPADIQIEIKYIEDEGLYIANLVDMYILD